MSLNLVVSVISVLHHNLTWRKKTVLGEGLYALSAFFFMYLPSLGNGALCFRIVRPCVCPCVCPESLWTWTAWGSFIKFTILMQSGHYELIRFWDFLMFAKFTGHCLLTVLTATLTAFQLFNLRRPCVYGGICMYLAWRPFMNASRTSGKLWVIGAASPKGCNFSLLCDAAIFFQ